LYHQSADAAARAKLHRSSPATPKQLVPRRQLEPAAMSRPEMTGLMPMNADTDQPILTLADGMTLNVGALPTRRLDVVANTSPLPAGSVQFRDGNTTYRTRSYVP
jgi:hypothetical protein